MNRVTCKKMEALFEIYEPRGALIWLFSPHQLLNGEVPAQLLLDGREDEVTALIDQLESGAFV